MLMLAQTPPLDQAAEMTDTKAGTAAAGSDALGQAGTQLNQAVDLVIGYLPHIGAALVVLVVGWIVASLIAGGVRALLGRTGLGKRLASWLSNQGIGGAEPDASLARAVFYLLMLLVAVGVCQALQLTLVVEPLHALLNEVFIYIPRLFGAGLLLICAVVLASIARAVAGKLLASTGIDKTVSDRAAVPEGKLPLSQTLSETLYWLILLLFLPPILGALQMDGLLAPLQVMMSKILAFLPNLFTAALVLIIGWFIARIVRRVVTSLSATAGIDKLGDRIGLTSALGGRQLSGILGLVVYVFILIPVLIAALEAVQLEAVTQPASDMLGLFLSALPQIFGALVILALTFVLARLVGELVREVLTGLGFNNILSHLGLSCTSREGAQTPAGFTGQLVVAVLMLFGLTEALNRLGFTTLVDLIDQFLTFGGHLLMGIVVIGVGLYAAKLAAGLIRESGAANAELLARLARVAIIIFAGAMGLRHMGIANEIINTAFGLLLGAVAVAVAVAFGVGGRGVAARKLEAWIGCGSDRDAAP